MAAKAISDINENVLRCSICHERFETPKTLGCQHSFCLTCIKGWVETNGGVLSCPMCRREFDVPAKGLIALPSSYFINQLLEYTTEVEGVTEEVNDCVMCNTAAASHCMECSAFLCTSCAGNHCKILPCRGHTVMPLEKYKSMGAKERAAAKPVMCPKHVDVAVEFYCDDCGSPVCMKCTVVDHKGHALQELETAFEMFRKEANEILSHCSTKEREMTAELRKHIQDTAAEKQSASKCEQEVNLHAQTLHRMVDEAKKKVLADLATRSRSSLQTREKEKIVKQEKRVQLQSVSLFIESLVKAPQPRTALFDSKGTLSEARKMVGQYPQEQRNMYQSRRNRDAYAVIIRDARVADSNRLKSQMAMSFDFHENQKLTRLLENSIGSIISRPLNQAQADRGFGMGIEVDW